MKIDEFKISMIVGSSGSFVYAATFGQIVLAFIIGAAGAAGSFFMSYYLRKKFINKDK